MNTEPRIIEAELVPKESITIAGSGRMANYMLPRLAHWKERSQRTFDIDLVSPNAVQLVKVTRDATAAGLSVRPVEAKIENVIRAEEDGTRRAYVLGIDDIAAIEKTLLASITSRSRILITIFLNVPGEGLLGFVILLGVDDEPRKRELAKLFAALKPVAINEGANSMFGAANKSMESMMRALMVSHVTDTLDKFLADLPAHADILVTRDGRSAVRLVIEDSSDGFKMPDALARSVMATVSTPLKPGSDFMIAEIGPGGVRFHSARLRAVDGQITINGAEVFDVTPTLKESVVRTLDKVRESAVARAIERAARNTATILNPVAASD